MPLLIPSRVNLPHGPLSEEALRALLAGYQAGRAHARGSCLFASWASWNFFW